MSLFGDSHSPNLTDSSPGQSSLEAARDENAVNVSAAQAAQDFDTFIEDELENTSDTDQRETSALHHLEADRQVRPNRFEGTAAQWRRLTKEERGLASSLDQLRAGDLSSHLYNAYALKRNARRSSAHVSSADSRNVDGHVLPQGRSKKERNWVPGASWTAWPLPPDLVPQSNEQFGVVSDELPLGNGLDAELLPGPTDELRQQLHALLQTHAKELWMADGGSINPPTASQATEFDKNAGSDPTVLTDDDEAHEILQPTVNSVVAKIDHLLLALHHSRNGAADLADTLQQERGRSAEIPSKASNSEIMTQLGGAPSSRDGSRSAPRERTTGKAGRPKIYDKRDNESHYQMQKRLAYERSRSRGANTGTVPNLTRLPGDGDYYGMYKRLAQGTQELQQHKYAQAKPQATGEKGPQPNGNPRDWSEVLNMAAQQGFSAEVVRRAANRCSKLFNEDMVLRSMDDTSVTDFAIASVPELNESATRHAARPNSRKHTKRQRMASEAELHLTCPIQSCSWYRKRFANAKLRDRHVSEVHGPQTMTQYSAENVLEDGVHMDGFLQMIPQ